MQENQQQEQEKTHGEPCPECGCPYPGDHTLDCQRGKRQQDMEMVVALLDKMASTMRNLLNAVSGLRDICLHQQRQIDRLIKHETDQPL